MLIRLVREGDVQSLYENRLCGVTFEKTAELVAAAIGEERGEELRCLVAVDEGGGVVGDDHGEADGASDVSASG